MRRFFCDSLKRFLMACALTVVGIFSATAATLPSGYTELEYIESTGTQYIDTGIVGKSGVSVEAKFIIADNSSGAVIGNRVGEERFFPVLWWKTSTEPKPKWDSTIGTDTAVGTVEINTLYTTYFVSNSSGWTFSVNGEQISQGTSVGTNTNNMWIFGINKLEELQYPFKGKVYYAKIWQNGTLVRDFVPAKNASGVVGMYDTVRNEFYTNQGSGTFTAGPIACNGTRVNYTTATGTVTQSGTPTPTNPITPMFYQQGDMVLRRVADWADSYDATTGKITRRIGVKVLDGTEDFTYGSPLASMFNLKDIQTLVYASDRSVYSTHFKTSVTLPNQSERYGFIERSSEGKIGIGYLLANGSVDAFKSWVAEQYAAGTPVTVYYPLATAVEDDWPAEQCIVSDGIKIATTKYTEDAFAGLMTTLSEAITKVTNIVDTTVQQATEIGNLATTKQDRPDTDCPAGRKCLLIMGADNKPHWYLIQE